MKGGRRPGKGRKGWRAPKGWWTMMDERMRSLYEKLPPERQAMMLEALRKQAEHNAGKGRQDKRAQQKPRGKLRKVPSR